MRHLLAQRRLAMLIVAVTLLLKLLVPTGYMIAGDHGRIAVVLCPGTVSVAGAAAMPGMHGDMADHGASPSHGKAEDHGKAEMPCAFAGLSAAALGAIDPVLLAAFVAFVLALGLAATTLPARSQLLYLRPPPRGPPASL